MPPFAAAGAADDLRALILAGEVRPGDHLDEVRVARQLQVSRNTVREAFRVLAQEELVEHRPNRGVFVRRLSVKEARDVYAARRLLECGALRQAAVRRATVECGSEEERTAFADDWSKRLLAIRAAVEHGDRAAAAADWDALGTANGEFHLALAQLADNQVIARTMRLLITEMRLLFVVVGAARDVHERYLIENRHLIELVGAGGLLEAAVALEGYLLRAEEHLVGAYAAAGDA